MIVSHDRVFIDEGTIIAPHVYIYDHDHKIENGIVSRNTYNKKAVYIGKNVWIGANTVILRGTEIGDNCVIVAGCVIKGKYTAGSVIIQKRIEEVK